MLPAQVLPLPSCVGTKWCKLLRGGFGLLRRMQPLVLHSVQQSPEIEIVAHNCASCICREQALELLKRGWPPGDEPRYDPDHALMLCRMAGFKLGLIFLYENLRLFREVLQVRQWESSGHSREAQTTLGTFSSQPSPVCHLP